MTTPNVGATWWTPALTQVAVQTAAYTASPNQLVPVDTTSGSVTVTLPTGTPAGSLLGVKMVIQGGTNTVTISSVAGDVFNKPGGSATMTLTLLNQGVLLEYNAGIWYVVSDDLALSTLDTRYLKLSGGTMTGAIAMGSNKITGLTNGSGAQDAAAFGQVLPLAGGTMTGILHAGAGTDSSGSAPVLTGVAGTNGGGGVQLSDLTRDYQVYLEVGTVGTAWIVSMGHTSSANDVTLHASGVATAGQVLSFRLPAAWYFLWSATTATLAQSVAVGC